MSNKDDLYDEMIEAIAKKISESNIMAFSIAERLRKDDEFLSQIMAKVEPEVLARALAQQIIYANNQHKRGHVNEKAIVTYQDILKQAKHLASKQIAADMVLKISNEVQTV